MAKDLESHLDTLMFAQRIPVVGDVVHFGCLKIDGKVRPPAAGIITFVHSPTVVTLAYYRYGGIPDRHERCEYSDTLEFGKWTWPRVNHNIEPLDLSPHLDDFSRDGDRRKNIG